MPRNTQTQGITLLSGIAHLGSTETTPGSELGWCIAPALLSFTGAGRIASKLLVALRRSAHSYWFLVLGEWT